MRWQDFWSESFISVANEAKTNRKPETSLSGYWKFWGIYASGIWTMTV
jgi:hypothetical protein